MVFLNNANAHGFLTIENTGKNSEYLIDIIPQFSKKLEILKKDDTSERYININLKVGLEIPGGEAIYFDEDTFKLIFLNIEQDLEWLDAHLANLIFKKMGKLK